MSDCTHDCSTCGESCADRKNESPFQIKPLREGCRVGKVYGVVSGKGGVGKSMVTSQLAVTMQRRGHNVAVLDADITGPSIPKAFGIHGRAVATEDAILPVIMRMPDVVSTESEAISEEEHTALIAAAETAAAQLDAFRAQEGAILIADLLRRVELIEQYKTEVVPFEKARTETVKARILDNLSKLAVDVDRNRLEQEMIFYLEKLDITEEKVRLTNHCNYFREVASSEEGAGRKLGFIAQEMGREINTMGSKANEPNIQILVVKMKDELEKIKEQVLNIL